MYNRILNELPGLVVWLLGLLIVDWWRLLTIDDYILLVIYDECQRNVYYTTFQLDIKQGIEYIGIYNTARNQYGYKSIHHKHSTRWDPPPTGSICANHPSLFHPSLSHPSSSPSLLIVPSLIINTIIKLLH